MSENQLRTCLDSVLGQTYQNLEIILINYGSMNDMVMPFAVNYAARGSRILYFKRIMEAFRCSLIHVGFVEH